MEKMINLKKKNLNRNKMNKIINNPKMIKRKMTKNQMTKKNQEMEVIAFLIDDVFIVDITKAFKFYYKFKKMKIYEIFSFLILIFKYQLKNHIKINLKFKLK